jgi:hypothetical protein
MPGGKCPATDIIDLVGIYINAERDNRGIRKR